MESMISKVCELYFHILNGVYDFLYPIYIRGLPDFFYVLIVVKAASIIQKIYKFGRGRPLYVRCDVGFPLDITEFLCLDPTLFS